MGQKSTSGGTQTTTTEPPAYLKPYLNQAAGAAQGLYGSGGPQTYQGSTVASPGNETQMAEGGIISRATQGSPLIDQAQSYVQNGLQQPITSIFGTANPYASPVDAGSGNNPYATAANPFGGASNPYLDATYDKAFGKGMQSIESQFARGGRNISSSLPVAGDLASNLASQIYAPAYENERNRQLSYGQQQLGIGANSFENQQARQLQSNLAGQSIGAQAYDAGQGRQLSDISQQRSLQQNLLGYASPLAAQDYADLAALQGVGANRDAYAQAQLNDQINRYNTEQMAPQQNLDAYIQRLQGMPGSSVTQQLPTQYRNASAGALGGALGGAQLGSSYGPYGSLFGAIGGGLLGSL
jgi:hypothetical protein